MTHESIQRLHDIFMEQAQTWERNKADFETDYCRALCQGQQNAYIMAAYMVKAFAGNAGISLTPYIHEENIVS